MLGFAIYPSENKEYFYGRRTILSSIGFGLLGAYVYGAITNFDSINFNIFCLMIISLACILVRYLTTRKSVTWYGKSPVNRQMTYWRKLGGLILVFLSQITVGVFCSLFNDLLLSGENYVALIILYCILIFICLVHYKIMVVSAVEPKLNWFKRHWGQ